MKWPGRSREMARAVSWCGLGSLLFTTRHGAPGATSSPGTQQRPSVATSALSQLKPDSASINYAPAFRRPYINLWDNASDRLPGVLHELRM